MLPALYSSRRNGGPLSTEDLIRDLCARAAIAEGAELEEVIRELNRILREHFGFVRKMTARTLLHRNQGASWFFRSEEVPEQQDSAKAKPSGRRHPSS